MILLEKTPENILQEELLREKAEVLSRAGEQVAEALQQLQNLEEAIAGLLQYVKENSSVDTLTISRNMDAGVSKRMTIEEINEKITQYNDLRENAKLRYHYLIITREAMGMRRHHWVEAIYKIPERKGHLYDL